MLGNWKDLGRVARLVNRVQYTYFVSSNSVLIRVSQLRLSRIILRGLRPPPRDVTGDRRYVAPVANLYHPRLPFSFEGGSFTSRARKPSDPHSPLIRGLCRSCPSLSTAVGRPEGRPAFYHLYMNARCTLRGRSANRPMSKLTISLEKTPGVDRPPGILCAPSWSGAVSPAASAFSGKVCASF